MKLNIFIASVLSIPNVECMGQLIDTFEETTSLLATYGISRRFLAGLSNIQFVAGDIPEAENFRKQLKSTYDAYEQLVTYQESNITVNATDSSNLDTVGVQKRPASNSAVGISFYSVPFALLLISLCF